MYKACMKHSKAMLISPVFDPHRHPEKRKFLTFATVQQDLYEILQ